MDFSRAGAVENLSDAHRAHVQWKEKGVKRHVHGPRRPDKQAEQDDRYRRPSVVPGTYPCVFLVLGHVPLQKGTWLSGDVLAAPKGT